jgi:hypothetical protein
MQELDCWFGLGDQAKKILDVVLLNELSITKIMFE